MLTFALRAARGALVVGGATPRTFVTRRLRELGLVETAPTRLTHRLGRATVMAGMAGAWSRNGNHNLFDVFQQINLIFSKEWFWTKTRQRATNISRVGKL